MSKQILSEEFKRMQKLAGINLNESMDISEDKFDQMLDNAWTIASDNHIPEEDPQGFLNNVDFIANREVKAINPNYSVSHTHYHGGKIEFALYDEDAEENIMTNSSYSF